MLFIILFIEIKSGAKDIYHFPQPSEVNPIDIKNLYLSMLQHPKALFFCTCISSVTLRPHHVNNNSKFLTLNIYSFEECNESVETREGEFRHLSAITFCGLQVTLTAFIIQRLE
jgi:hypothetical protein